MEKIEIILNIVTCGQCSEPFGHTIDKQHEKLHCPYCDFQDDISSFPDLYYPPDFPNSLSLITN